MLIIERILSLFIFVIILFVILFFILKLKKKSNVILNSYILILSIMGYCYEPLKGKNGNIDEGADLNRIWYYFDYYSFHTFGELWRAIKNSTTPGVELYYFIISKLDNKHFLPSITAFITFYFCFGIIKTILKKDKKINSNEIVISIFLFMSRGLFLQTISNIRTMLGFSIIAWCTYQEFYNNKKVKDLLIYYMLAASFHPVVQVIGFYRIVYFFFQRKKYIFEKIKFICLGLGLMLVVYFWGMKYILKILSKGAEYISSTENGTGYFYIWEYFLSVISIMIVVYLINIFKKYYKIGHIQKKNDSYSIATYNLINYIKPLIYVDIVFSFIEFSFFHRISWYLSMLSIPLTIYVIRQKRIVNKKTKNLINKLIIGSLFILLVSCIRGDLCGLNFFKRF